MNFDKWKSNIKALNMDPKTSDTIIRFFNDFGYQKSFNIIQLNNHILMDALSNINNYRPITICMDCEFQKALDNTGRYQTFKNMLGDDYAMFIREFGLMFFIHTDDDKWFYIGHVFVNFKPLKYFGIDPAKTSLLDIGSLTLDTDSEDLIKAISYDFGLENMIAPLANKELFSKDKKDDLNKIVDDIINKLKLNYLFKKFGHQNIIIKLLEIKKASYDESFEIVKYVRSRLSKIKYEIYLEYLNHDLKVVMKQIASYYWNDPAVMRRVKLTLDKERQFFDQFENLTNNTVFVIKGMMDIVAIHNMGKLIANAKSGNYNHSLINIRSYYDIENFNGVSSRFFKSAQLEITYHNLLMIGPVDHDINNIFNKINESIGKKAHNPVVDSYFTFVVAVIMNMILNDHFAGLVAIPDVNEFNRARA